MYFNDHRILDGVQTGRFMSQVKIELKAIQLKQQIFIKSLLYYNQPI